MTIVTRNTNTPRRTTNWDAFDSLTDEDIAKAVAEDSDAAPLMTEEEAFSVVAYCLRGRPHRA